MTYEDLVLIWPMMDPNIFLQSLMTSQDQHGFYIMKNKSQTWPFLQSFCSLVETQFQTKVKTIQSNNGVKFSMKNFYMEKGIIHLKSCVESPQQNEIVEHKHQHILNIARALCFQFGIPICYWNDCVMIATYLINRTPSPNLQNQTPYQLLFKVKPSYSHLKTFGCLCYASTLTTHCHNFDSHARKCILLGYPFGVKGYKLLDL